jgi:hypothetical protein
MNQPSYSDLVMGGQTPNLRGSLVLGGIDGIKKQLASNSELQRCEALYQAVKYGEKGKAVIVKALQDPSSEVRYHAYRLLMALSEESEEAPASLKKKNKDATEAKKALKSHLEEELGEYSGAIVGTDFPLRLEQSQVRNADVVAIFPSGYMVAFMLATKPINTQELSRISYSFLNNGIDVMWWLGEEADTPSNRRWSINYCGYTYILKTAKIPIIDKTSQAGIELNVLSEFNVRHFQSRIRGINWLLQYKNSGNDREQLIEEKEELENLLKNGQPLSGLGQSIFARAIRVTFHTWRRLNNAQLKRGLLVQNKGVKSFGGILGSLSSHNHHSRITAIAKTNDGYWKVTDDEQLMASYLGFRKDLSPPSGVQAMKKRAHTIALIKTTSR